MPRSHVLLLICTAKIHPSKMILMKAWDVPFHGGTSAFRMLTASFRKTREVNFILSPLQCRNDAAVHPLIHCCDSKTAERENNKPLAADVSFTYLANESRDEPRVSTHTTLRETYMYALEQRRLPVPLSSRDAASVFRGRYVCMLPGPGFLTRGIVPGCCRVQPSALLILNPGRKLDSC